MQRFTLFRAPHASLTLLFLCLFLMGVLQLPIALTDPDVGWHIAAGDWIRNHAEIPVHDPFSHTAGETRWLNISWSWDVVISWVHSWSGAIGISLVTLGLYVFTVVLLLWHARQRGAGLVIAVMLLLLAFPNIMVTFSVRPHQVTILLLLLNIILLQQRRLGCMKLHYYLPLLALLTIIWANTHGAFLTLFVLFGAYGIEALWQRNKTEFLTLFMSGLVGLAALCVNPLGIGIFEACWRTLGGELMANIMEWQPLSFKPENWSRILYPVTLLIFAIPLWRHVSLPERLLSGFWLVCACISQRHAPVFAVMSYSSFAVALTCWIAQEKPRLLHWTIRKSDEYERDLGSQKIRKLLFTISLLSTFTAPVIAQHTLYSQGIPFPKDKDIKLLQPYSCLKMLNHYNLGGWIIYETRGSLPVFMDGRAETVYPPNIVNDYIAFEELNERTPGILEKYNIELVAATKDNQHLVTYFNALGEWQEATRGENLIVFVKKGRMNNPCLAGTSP